MGIKICGLNKKFKINKYEVINALDNINISFENVGSYLLFGESGSGKSTFLKILYGLMKQDSGKIFVNNIETNGLGEFNSIYIPQDYGLVENLNVIDNLKLSLNGLIDFDELKFNIESVFKKLGIEDLLNQQVKYLSGGERAKVAFSRILLGNAKIILLDEPTASIDKNYSIEIYKLIKEISKDRLIIVVSHDERIKDYVDNTYLMNSGKIKQAVSNEIKNKEKIEKINRKINDRFAINKIYKNHKVTFLFSFIMIFSICIIFVLIDLCLVSDYKIIGTVYQNSDVNYLYSNSEFESQYLSDYTYYNYSMDLSGDVESAQFYFSVSNKLIIDDDLDDGVLCVSDYTLNRMIHTEAIDYLNDSNDDYKTVDQAVGETYSLNGCDFTMEYYETDYENHTYEKTYDDDYLDYECSFYMMNLSTFKKFYFNSEYYYDDEGNYDDSVLANLLFGYKNDNSNFNNDSIIFEVYSGEKTNYEGEIINSETDPLEDDEIILNEGYFTDYSNISSFDFDSYIGQSISIDFTYGSNDVEETFIIKDFCYDNSKYFNGSDSSGGFVSYVSENAWKQIYLDSLGDIYNTAETEDISYSYVYKINNNSNYISLMKELCENSVSIDTYMSSTVDNILLFVNNIQSLSINLIKIFIAVDFIMLVIFLAFDYKFTNKNYKRLESYGYLKKDVIRLNLKISVSLFVLSIPILLVLTISIGSIINLNIENFINIKGSFVKFISLKSIYFYLINIIIFIGIYNSLSIFKIKYKE